jgi:hypothetical protein
MRRGLIIRGEGTVESQNVYVMGNGFKYVNSLALYPPLTYATQIQNIIRLLSRTTCVL